MTDVSMRAILFLFLISTCIVFGAPAAPTPAAAPASPPPAQKPWSYSTPDFATEIANVEYVSGGGPERSLDLYRPKNVTGPMPVILYIHGGGWVAFKKTDWHPSFDDLLSHGFAVASINYRLAPGATFPAQIFDCKAAVRWLRANAEKYQLDPARIGTWGHSAGGHLASMLGTTNGVAALEGDEGVTGFSSDVVAACNWSGPSDLSAILSQDTANPGRLAKAVITFLGGPDKATSAAPVASPVTYVNAKSVPFLIQQGARDDIVPLEQTAVLEQKLKEAGVEVTRITIPNEGHGLGSPADVKPVTEFFVRHLQPTNPAGAAGTTQSAR